jgi:L-lactate dehydrogenase complex protein LldG
MSSRTAILNAIRAISREEKPLPEVPLFELSTEVESAFIRSIEGNKGEVMTETDFLAWLEQMDFPRRLSFSEKFSNLSNLNLPEDPHELEDLNLAVLEGQFGVAENGAIWIDDRQLPHRVLPFITEHLVIVLNRSQLLPTLHQAYERIGNTESGFGLFVAGPSKTADIEQSLVIGAHGAKSLRVILMD